MSEASEELLVEAVDILESNDLLGEQSRGSMRDKLARSLQRVVDKAVTASTEFHFATATYTHTFTDSVNVLDLKTANGDIRDVYTIMWGSTLKMLRKYDQYEKDLSFAGLSVTGVPKGWVRRESNDSGYPRVEIIGEVSSGDVMTYRYLRSGISFADWPSDWLFVLRDGMLMNQFRNQFRAQYNNSLQQMIDFYEAPSRGGHMALPSPEIINANVIRNSQRYTG